MRGLTGIYETVEQSGGRFDCRNCASALLNAAWLMSSSSQEAELGWLQWSTDFRWVGSVLGIFCLGGAFSR
ncbi:hypothetical protein PGT21_015782 [Puccinia graminis f. sp. tritici]|uniref:Uncharacterized protein n=1 Tax=Puccinia graminis f. sp. tritici TaxID=56615 RepID=A0A5B0LMN0_PUCGR|nr:hypothetical protein PGTUg99_021620 [Puccinia graminis f. sp. tritici]KAA1090857.1 hypothetical protein PGT21_015782 [Puccinia graminis f. sp. tritici]